MLTRGLPTPRSRTCTWRRAWCTGGLPADATSRDRAWPAGSGQGATQPRLRRSERTGVTHWRRNTARPSARDSGSCQEGLELLSHFPTAQGWFRKARRPDWGTSGERPAWPGKWPLFCEVQLHSRQKIPSSMQTGPSWPRRFLRSLEETNTWVTVPPFPTTVDHALPPWLHSQIPRASGRPSPCLWPSWTPGFGHP